MTQLEQVYVCVGRYLSKLSSICTYYLTAVKIKASSQREDKGRDCGGMRREECTVWSYGSVNMPFKASGHEFKVRAVSVVVYASPFTLSRMDSSGDR